MVSCCIGNATVHRWPYRKAQLHEQRHDGNSHADVLYAKREEDHDESDDQYGVVLVEFALESQQNSTRMPQLQVGKQFQSVIFWLKIGAESIRLVAGFDKRIGRQQ